MDQIIPVMGPLHGVVEVPGDKSLAHRALLLAALAEGVSHIANLPPGRDVQATASALRALGVEMEELPDGSLRVHGAGGRFADPKELIDCMNSGTTMRLLTGVLAGAGVNAELVGDASLTRRPMERVARPLRLMGADLSTRDGRPPIIIRPGRFDKSATGEKGGLKGRLHRTCVPSAQVKSAILLAGLFAQGTTTVIESRASRDHTERFFDFLGIGIKRDCRQDSDGQAWIVSVEGPARPRPFTLTLAADPSSAAFVAAAAAISEDAEISIPRVLANPLRRGFFRVLEKMGAKITSGPSDPAGPEEWGTITVRSGALRGVHISGALALDSLDELPLIALLGAFASGETHIRDAKELRYKESDRIRSTARLIRRLGGEVEEWEDGLRVVGMRPLHGAVVDSEGDHRIALAAAVAGTRLPGVVVRGFEAARVSFPGFLEALENTARRGA